HASRDCSGVGNGGGDYGRFDLSRWPGRHHTGHPFILWASIRAGKMTTMEAMTIPPSDAEPRYLQWSPVILGALAATALCLLLITFAAAVGLGVSSTAPTWRDASVALWLLSGIYLILQ